jgi:hypothetical protein
MGDCSFEKAGAYFLDVYSSAYWAEESLDWGNSADTDCVLAAHLSDDWKKVDFDLDLRDVGRMSDFDQSGRFVCTPLCHCASPDFSHDRENYLDYAHSVQLEAEQKKNCYQLLLL